MAELLLKVESLSEVASGTLCLRLSLGGKPFPFKPGQYAMVSVAEMEAKSFSICSSPTKEGYIEFATRNTGSDFKKAWAALKPGDEVKVSGPFGKFVLDESLPVIAILSGGVGITPLRSMIQYATDRKLPNKIILLYSNRKPEDIPFREELEQLARENPNLKLVNTLTEAEKSQQPWEGRRGKIDEGLIREMVPDALSCTYYSCGPPGMVGAMKDLLLGMGVPKEKIKTENFEGY